MNPINVLPLMATPAGTDAATSGGGLMTILPFALIIVVFYLLIIRPQNKQQKEKQKMLETLKKGDRIETIGGVIGVIHTVKEKNVIVKVDGETKMEFRRSAIAAVLESSKDEAKALEEKKDTPAEAKRGGFFSLFKKNDAENPPVEASQTEQAPADAEDAKDA
jgi:preprotein translocase subunit YajC